MSRPPFRILVALTWMCMLVVPPAHSQPELAGHPVAPGHAAFEALPVTVPDGAGGVFVAFKSLPLGSVYSTLSVYVAHAGANGEPIPGWTPVAIGSHANIDELPPILAASSPRRAWVAADLFFSTCGCTPYLARAAGASGLTFPDSSQWCGADRSHNSLVEIGSGRMLIASKYGAGGAGGLFLAIIEATGELNEVPLPIGIPGGGWRRRSLDDERGPVMLADGAGGAWVLADFTYTNGPLDQDIAAFRIAADGSSALSPSSRVVCAAQSQQYEARPALDDANGVFIVWTDRRDPAKAAIFASHLLADGSFASGVPLYGRAIASFVGDQFQPQIVSDGSGGAWVAWIDNRSGENDLYYTRIGPDCQPRSGFPVGGRALCAAAGSQINAQLAADGEGGFYAVWLDQRDGEVDLYGQHIHSTGVVMPGWIADGLPICTEGSAQAYPSVVLSSPHHAIATWSDTRTGYQKVYATTLPEDGPTAGVSSGMSRRLSLAPVVNPVRNGIELRVSSADDGPIRVTLVDVSGRVQAEQVIAGPTHGALLRFEAPGPGLYFLRADQRGVHTSGRVAVVR